MRESLNLITSFTFPKLIYSSVALDGGSIKEANSCLQWYFIQDIFFTIIKFLSLLLAMVSYPSQRSVRP